MKPVIIMKKILFISALTGLAFCGLFASSTPLFRANAERTGAKDEYTRPPLSYLWHYTIQGEFISSPAYYKGALYCGARDRSIWAWDAETGEVLWQHDTGAWIDASPCVSTGTLFIPSRDKYVYAYDRFTGESKWQTYTGSNDASSPVLYNGILYFLGGTPNKKIFALNAESGNIIHEYDMTQYGFSSPAVKDNILFCGSNDGVFSCIDLENGQTIWSKQTRGGIYFSCAAFGADAIYAVSGGDERKLFCLDPSNGNVIWQSEDIESLTAQVSSVALGKNSVIVASSSGGGLKLISFPLTGTTPVAPLWSTAIGEIHQSGIISSPALADDCIYIGSGNGNLYCIDVESGQYIEPATGNLTAAVTGYFLSYIEGISTGIVSTPCIADGRVFVSGYDGAMWALKASKVNSISLPDDNDIIISSAPIIGTITESGEYSIEYGQGANPVSWTQVATGTTPVNSGLITHFNAETFSNGIYSLRIVPNADPSKAAINRFTVHNAPQAPNYLDVHDTPFDGGGSLTLFWHTSADDGGGNNSVTGYRIYKSSSGDVFAPIAETAKGATQYIDNDCGLQTTFYYQVTAFDALTESARSNTASACSLLDGILISPAGGTVSLSYGGGITEVVFEANAISSGVYVGIKVPESYSNSGIPNTAEPTSIVREFGVSPADTVFLKNVTIKIPYNPADIVNKKRENLRIWWWDESKSEWRIVNTSDPMTEDGRVWASIPHFSIYRIMEYVPGREALLSKNKVYTYPNPAKGDTVYFKYFVGDIADIVIDIYSVTGELIAHLEKNANPAGLVSELPWNISNIASGTYIYRIEARGASGATRSLKKKMAIVH